MQVYLVHICPFDIVFAKTMPVSSKRKHMSNRVWLQNLGNNKRAYRRSNARTHIGFGWVRAARPGGSCCLPLSLAPVNETCATFASDHAELLKSLPAALSSMSFALGQSSARWPLFQQRIKRKGLGIEMRPVWTCGSEKHYRNIYRTPNEQVPFASKSLW